MKVEKLKILIENAPETPGVYQMFDHESKLLYVGKAKNLKKRLNQYTDLSKVSARIGQMVLQIDKVDILTTKTETEALILESDLIKNRAPKYNILLTDDKMYPLMNISDDNFPRLIKFRGKITAKRDVFGPYPSVGALNETVKLIQRVCLLRTCSNAMFKNRVRPCLLYQIGRCSGPCCDKISHGEYIKNVEFARSVLSGKSDDLIRELSVKMAAASNKMDYESATRFRDQIQAISTTVKQGKHDTRNVDYFVGVFDGAQPIVGITRQRNGQIISAQTIYPKHTDDMTNSEILESSILWFYNDCTDNINIVTSIQISENVAKVLREKFGRKININMAHGSDKGAIDQIEQQMLSSRRFSVNNIKKWDEPINDLKNWLGIEINRVDVFDNSHLFGKHPVGSMIVFGADGFNKKEYRHFKLEDLAMAGNDIGMMHEFLLRRYSKAEVQGTIPSLIIVDGGRAQWNVAKSVQNEIGLDIPTLGVVKGVVRSGDEHFIMPDGSEVKIEKDTKLFNLMGAVRDEAHRFAISFHRKQRAKSAVGSALDAIEGIGGTRKKALLAYFGSVNGIIDASIENLTKVDGISKSTAEKIYRFFHKDALG